MGGMTWSGRGTGGDGEAVERGDLQRRHDFVVQTNSGEIVEFDVTAFKESPVISAQSVHYIRRREVLTSCEKLF